MIARIEAGAIGDMTDAQAAILAHPSGPKLFAYLREAEDALGGVVEWDPHADIGACAWCHEDYISDIDECNDACQEVYWDNDAIPTGLVEVPAWWEPKASGRSGKKPPPPGLSVQEPDKFSAPKAPTAGPVVGMIALGALLYFGAFKR
jgi:hypothetical protein